MKFIQIKIIDELFLIFFINYFIIICFFNFDFFNIIYNLLITNLDLNLLLLINFFFFFVIPKKKKKKEKILTLKALIKYCRKMIFKSKKTIKSTILEEPLFLEKDLKERMKTNTFLTKGLILDKDKDKDAQPEEKK
jgi:hypothetical protein